MGASISNIAVNVGMNAAGLQKGAQQAAAAVKSFTAQTRQSVAGLNGVANGMGNVSTLAQQGVFAVDDFMAAFHTGGVAGGLRGAANNLTMIAASIGGIKAQLLLIAALSVGQLIAKQFGNAAGEAKEVTDATQELEHSLQRIERTMAGIAEVRALSSQKRDFSKLDSSQSAIDAKDDVTKRIQDQQNKIADAAETFKRKLAAMQTIEESQVWRETGNLLEGTPGFEAQKRLLDEFTAEQKQNARTLKELSDQRAMLDRRTIPELQAAEFRKAKAIGDAAFGGFKPFVTEADRAAMRAKQDEIAAIDEEISSIRGRGAMSMAEMFTRFAGANTMGSIGAISTIHSSQFGPQNARSAEVMSLKNIERDQRRVRELMEKRQSLEVVGL